ncbi:hypothetical protein F183_A48590 [Bryobacterales bacterium F-183]|nr:hypothetical protein F183_A48590 [Bryobacterales bacterium F-183]
MLYKIVSLFVISSTFLFSQSTAGLGGINGVVTDASGAAVPKANVTVENDAKGIRRALTTNDAGIFNVPSLIPAEGYSVRVEAAGFSAYEVKNITLQVGQNLGLTVNLQVQAANQTVDVTAQAPIVESTKTGMSQTVNQKQIDELPINGRRVDSFVLLAPAVVPDGTFGLVSFRGIAGGNSFLTDGNDTTNQFYNENAGRTRISSQISQDAVQEFQVLTNGYSAEFGRASGGVINTVTRSGGNQTHGTAYWFFRNQDFNARDSYSATNPQERRDQFGGSLGGRIIKDKLFYFGNVELTRRDFPLVNRLVNPNLFNANGAFIAACSSPAAACQTAYNAIFTRQFQTLDRSADSELAFAKIDWRPTDRHSFAFSGNYLRWISPNGIQTQAVLTNGNGIGNNANSTVRTRYGRASWTAVPTNTTVNELRFGWFKDRLFDDVNNDLISPATGRLGLSIQGQSNLGTAVDYPRLNPSEQRFSIADSFSWTRGKHSMKFGFDIANTQDYFNILRNQFGSYSYGTWSDFVLDFNRIDNGDGRFLRRWQSFTQTVGNPIIDFTTRDYAFFVQDQWRATQKLTLNYGVRYDYSQLPQPENPNRDYPATGIIRSPGKNFAPRFGLAYALNDKTVIRTGYGIFYARFQGGLLQTVILGNGSYQPSVLLQNGDARGPQFPNILPSNASGLPGGAISLNLTSSDFRNPYTQQWDFAIERQLAYNLGMTVNYIGSRGVALTTVRDLNIGALGAPVTYRILDAAGNQTGTFSTPGYYTANRVDTRYQRINQIENGGNSYYHALAVQLQKRMSRGFQASVAYTWSHAIDTANQQGGNNAIFFSSPFSTYNGDYSADKGTSSLDQRHRAVLTSVWEPQWGKQSSNAFVKYVVANWQFSHLTTLASGQPVTTTMRVVGSPFTGAAFNTSLNGFGGSSRVPFLPFSNLNLDPIYRADVRVTKILRFTERVNMALNFEAFNVSNSQYNTGIITEAFNASGGVIRPSNGLGNGTASQGFPDGTNARRAQVSARFVF